MRLRSRTLPAQWSARNNLASGLRFEVWTYRNLSFIADCNKFQLQIWSIFISGFEGFLVQVILVSLKKLAHTSFEGRGVALVTNNIPGCSSDKHHSLLFTWQTTFLAFHLEPIEGITLGDNKEERISLMLVSEEVLLYLSMLSLQGWCFIPVGLACNIWSLRWICFATIFVMSSTWESEDTVSQLMSFLYWPYSDMVVCFTMKL
jgi:hypothetical protein